MNSLKYFSSCLLVGIFLFSWEVSGGLYPQYIMLYPNNGYGCNGPDYEYFFQSVNMTGKPWTTVNIKGRGMWVLDARAGSLLFSDNDGSICLHNLDVANSNISVIQLLDVDLDDSGILFHPIGSYDPTTMIRSTAQELSFPSPRIGDIKFTGVKNYTLFSGLNFTGNSTCAVAGDLTEKDGFGINWIYPPITWPIGSFRVGCIAPSTRIIKAQTKAPHSAAEGRLTDHSSASNEMNANFVHETVKSINGA